MVVRNWDSFWGAKLAVGGEEKGPSAETKSSLNSETSPKVDLVATQSTSNKSIFPSGHRLTPGLSAFRNGILCFKKTHSCSDSPGPSSSFKVEVETEILQTESPNSL